MSKSTTEQAGGEPGIAESDNPVRLNGFEYFVMKPVAFIYAGRKHKDIDFSHLEPVTDGESRVYEVLLEHGSNPSNCFPSAKRLAALTGKKEGTVRNILLSLERKGWIERFPRHFSDGRQTSNGIQVNSRPRRGGSRENGGDPHSEMEGGFTSEWTLELKPTELDPTEQRTSTSEISDEPEPTSSEVVPVSDSSSDVTKPTAKHPDAQRLTETLFRCYALHADLEAPPKITQTSIRDMDLLLRRGPVELQPHEIKPEHVERVIHGIFDMLAERRDGFCWADQIRSPGNLRKHWTRIRGELNRNHQTRQTRDTDLDELIAIGFEMNRREAQQ